MTDTTETPSAAPVEDSRAHTKNLIFAALAEARIHKVSVEFDGSGDSGQIEDILAWNAAGDTVPLPSDRKVQLAAPLPGNPPVEMTFQDAIETLAYDYLEETHCGWENNDGAFGTFVFDVPGRAVTLEHNERYHQHARILREAPMAHPYHHALASVKKWGGEVSDYLSLHSWFDQSKPIAGDFRHRALRHHAEGIFMLETIFGVTITLSTGRVIPTRWVGEQHVQQDLGFIPSFADWMRAIRPLPWMGRAGRLDDRPAPAAAEPAENEERHDQS